MEIDKKNINEFMRGLEKLTRETGIEIGGCGCCGSPYLFKAEITSEKSGYAFTGPRNNYEQIQWIDPSDDYDWKAHAKKIIK